MDDSVPQSIYSIKKIDRKCRFVTQNKNGPCPILAVYNLLGLRGTLSIPDRSGISAEEMISSIGELVLSPKLTSQLDILQVMNLHNSFLFGIHNFPFRPIFRQPLSYVRQTNCLQDSI